MGHLSYHRWRSRIHANSCASWCQRNPLQPHKSVSPSTWRSTVRFYHIKDFWSLPVRCVECKNVLSALYAASPKENNGDVSWVIRTPWSPVPVSLHLLALQLKPSLPVRFEIAWAPALHTLPFGFNPSDATVTQGIGV